VSAQRNIFIVDGKNVIYVQYEQSSNIVAELTTKTDILEIDSEKANKEVDAEIEAQRNMFDSYKDQHMELIVSTYKKGFVVGTHKNFGFFNIYGLSKEMEVTLIQSFWFSLRWIGINSISVSFDKSYMVLSARVLDQNIEDQLKELQINDDENKHLRSRIELYRFSLADSYALKDANFKPIFKNGNPLGAILDISVAVSKNLIASVGEDKYLRIWEYSIKNSDTILTSSLSSDIIDTQYKQLSSYFSKEVMNSVSVHPMGLQLAVGTREGVKIFYIIEDGIKICLEIHGKQCLWVKYSNGGHFLAAGNGNNISIIDPYTYETLFTLIGHPSTVRFLKWTESDSHLLSNCNHGSSYGWYSNFEDYKNRGAKNEQTEIERIEFNLKYVIVNSFVYDEEYDICAVGTSDGKLTLMTTKKGCKTYLEIFSDGHTVVTALWLWKNSQALFVGTNTGIIRMYLWPILTHKAPQVSSNH
jgi:WD40 repeat protein